MVSNEKRIWIDPFITLMHFDRCQCTDTNSISFVINTICCVQFVYAFEGKKVKQASQHRSRTLYNHLIIMRIFYRLFVAYLVATPYILFTHGVRMLFYIVQNLRYHIKYIQISDIKFCKISQNGAQTEGEKIQSAVGISNRTIFQK